jgi:murein DD-endopeptidase MepM/ murein hydrolase activator NlpD
MFCVHEPLRSRSWPRAAVLALLTVGVAACSGEATRFGENPNRNNPESTGSISSGQAAPVGRVESRPLPQTSQLPPAQSGASAPATVAASPGIAGGGRGLASYSPPPASGAHATYTLPPSSTPNTYGPRPTTVATADVTGSVVAPKPAPAPAPSSNWSWDGGTAVTVAQGETVETIGRRYGVPASAIMQANNITAPGVIHPGQQLVIPRYSQSSAAAAPPAAVAPVTRLVVAAPKPASTPVPAGPKLASVPSNPGVHVVAPGDTLTKIARLYRKPVHEIAKANNIIAGARLNVGDRLVIPGVHTSAVKPNMTPKPAPVVAQAKPVASTVPAEPEQNASVFAPVGETTGSKDVAKPPDSALPKFRWPANGRVIQAYGPTTNGQQNDGINIALPENTPIKAAEDGVVAYAGNELKGYGNLVLVRHPNGYVTAYAHAKELVVKRGDQVKRGQMIARSGQTGNVNAPQLHFEIRKGASPLDPTRFLNGT